VISEHHSNLLSDLVVFALVNDGEQSFAADAESLGEHVQRWNAEWPRIGGNSQQQTSFHQMSVTSKMPMSMSMSICQRTTITDTDR